jgi:hypothetical protein
MGVVFLLLLLLLPLPLSVQAEEPGSYKTSPDKLLQPSVAHGSSKIAWPSPPGCSKSCK